MKKERIIIIAIILILLVISIITIFLININMNNGLVNKNKEINFKKYVNNLDYDISIVKSEKGLEAIYPAITHYSYDYINTEKKEMYYSSEAYFTNINAEYKEVDGHTIIGPIKLTDYQIELVKSIFDDNNSLKINSKEDYFSVVNYDAEYNGKIKHFTTLPINFKLWEEKEK